MGNTPTHAARVLDPEAATSAALLMEIDRFTAQLSKCIYLLALYNPKPLLVDGEEFGCASSYEEGIAQDKAREIARKLLKAADVNDLGGCPLCCG